VSANHILQNFLSAENLPKWKWAFTPESYGLRRIQLAEKQKQNLEVSSEGLRREVS
jgi:hypothetical protein